jgi:tRNA-splicing ligase RtcB
MGTSKGHAAVHPQVQRIDGTRAIVHNRFEVPITLFARPDVRVEPDGIDQILEVASLAETLSLLGEHERGGRIAPFWGGAPGRIDSIVLTPDFHRGAGIPVGTVIDARGFVIPGAVGNDVCCGMRLLATDVTREEIAPHLKVLEKKLRAIFFQGKRDIPMSPRQREALLREGLGGLHETVGDNADTGLWRYYDAREQADDVGRVHFEGALPARGTFAFDSWIRASGASDGRRRGWSTTRPTTSCGRRATASSTARAPRPRSGPTGGAGPSGTPGTR